MSTRSLLGRTWRWSALPTRRRLSLALAIVLAGSAALLAAAPAPPADAALREAQGWWWRAQQGIGPRLDPPPHVPQGGLSVAQAPDGASAVAAVRFRLSDTETNPILNLRVAREVGGPTAEVAACRTGSSWAPALAGTWSEKPNAPCALGAVEGVRSDDGSTWTFALQPLLLDDLVDVVIVPALGSPPFDLTFEPTTSDDLVTFPVAPAGRTPSPPPPPPSFQPPADRSTPQPQPVEAPPVTEPPFQAALPEPDRTVEPDAPLASAQQQTFGRNVFDPSPISRRADPRRLGILVLVGAATIAFMMSGEQVRPPVALGPVGHRRTPTGPDADDGAGASTTRGIGRFARARTGDAPRLL